MQILQGARISPCGEENMHGGWEPYFHAYFGIPFNRILAQDKKSGNESRSKDMTRSSATYEE